jgi:uncharacterized protein YegL
MDADGYYRRVAFMISDTEDTDTTEALLRSIKSAAPGKADPTAIVTDDAKCVTYVCC